MKVVAGVDGSKNSLEAIRFAANILDPQQDEFVIYHHPPQVSVANQEKLIPGISAEMRDAFLRSVFDSARSSLPESFRKSATTVVGTQKPAVGLLETADECAAGLIVVGADSRHSAFMPFLGGVAKKVAKRATCPVLVYRRAAEEPHDAPIDIMLTHDGSDAASEAGRQLNQFRWSKDARGHIVRVIEWVDTRVISNAEFSDFWTDDYAEYSRWARTAAADELTSLRETLPEFFANASVEIKDGGTVDEICSHVKDHKIDLVVAAPHNEGLVERLIGGTTESLLHYVPCSMLVCHGASPKN